MKSRWIWQTPGWPNLTVDAEALRSAEKLFLANLERQRLVIANTDESGAEALRIDWLANDAVQTSAIEGEALNRGSVQLSLMRRLGLTPPGVRRHGNAEEGIAGMMASLYQEAVQPLNHDAVCSWHYMLMGHERHIMTAGDYRRYGDPMQVVSNAPYGQAPTVYYEAPPSAQVLGEMNQYISWFNKATEVSENALATAAKAHLWFEAIHPFEDGNGRIGRALIEKSFARMFDRASLVPISAQIASERKDYYEEMQAACRYRQTLDITEWAQWFSGMAVRAQERGLRMARIAITKALALKALGERANERQLKALARMFDAEPEGFVGGMSAANYQSITKAPSSTATRDLAGLVAMGALRKTGERRHTRYWLDWESLDDLARTVQETHPRKSPGMNAESAVGGLNL